MARAGTEGRACRRALLWGAAWAAPVLLAAATPRPLPFDQVAPGTDYAVFYRVEDERQFLFVCKMPERRLVALEIDRKEGRDGGVEAEEEAGEIVHHLPIARLKGRIQYLACQALPDSRRHLLRLAHGSQAVFEGVPLTRTGTFPESWLGVDASLLPAVLP
jgi:hypothetical protein